MKKINILTALLFFILIFSACSNGDAPAEEKEVESKVSGEISEANNEDKSEFATIAEKSLKGIYNIDNFKLDLSSSNLKVFNSGDEINADTGEEYKNVINGLTKFTYRDKIYNLNLLYSKTSEDSYKILFIDTNLDHDMGMEVPLESDY